MGIEHILRSVCLVFLARVPCEWMGRGEIASCGLELDSERDLCDVRHARMS